MPPTPEQFLTTLHDPEPGFFEPLDSVLTDLTPELVSVGQAFRSNLSGVYSILSIPLAVSWASVLSAMTAGPFQGPELFDSGRLKALLASMQELPTDSINLAETAQELVKTMRLGSVIEYLLEELDSSARSTFAVVFRSPDLVGALESLMAQALVLTWSAAEIVSRDLFVALLNAQPMLAALLFNNNALRKRFRDNLRLDFEALSEQGFDLSSTLGDYLGRRISLDSLDTIKLFFHALFPDSSQLSSALEQPHLRLLFKKRNLIVHRGCLVDTRYLKETGEVLELGSTLPVAIEDVRLYLRVVRDLGVALLRAAADRV